jgi:hypothetical protein
MKKTRRVEITKYSRRVTVIRASSAVIETGAPAEWPVMDISNESQDSPSATDEFAEPVIPLSDADKTPRQHFRLRDLLKLLHGKQITKLHLVC